MVLVVCKGISLSTSEGIAIGGSLQPCGNIFWFVTKYDAFCSNSWKIGTLSCFDDWEINLWALGWTSFDFGTENNYQK